MRHATNPDPGLEAASVAASNPSAAQVYRSTPGEPALVERSRHHQPAQRAISGMLLFSVVLAVDAVVLDRRLVARFGTWKATLLATAASVVAVGTVEYLMPGIAETRATFPAPVLYDFRVVPLGAPLVLRWFPVLVFGALVGGSAPHGQRAAIGVENYGRELTARWTRDRVPDAAHPPSPLLTGSPGVRSPIARSTVSDTSTLETWAVRFADR